MTDIKVCTIGDELKATLKKFRFRKAKNNAGIIMKINMSNMDVEIEDDLEDISMEELAEELPEFSPRFIVYSYCYDHSDGRTSYPLCFIHYAPGGVKPEHNMVYAGTKTALVQATGMTKVFEVRDAEEMTEDWLKQRLGFFT